MVRHIEHYMTPKEVTSGEYPEYVFCTHTMFQHGKVMRGYHGTKKIQMQY